MVDHPAPSCLYRYRGYSQVDLADEARRTRIAAEIAAAKRGEVWFSPLSAQNDPFDTNPYYVRSPMWECDKLIRAFHSKYGKLASFSGMDLRKEGMKQGYTMKQLKWTAKRNLASIAYKEADKMIRSHADNMIVSCFSEKATDLLMWSYYSIYHSSFCLKFELIDKFSSDARMKVGKVKYVSDRPIITTVDVLNVLIKGTYDDANFVDASADSRFTDAFILTKSNHWIHEQEWRSLQRFKAPPGYYSIWPYRLAAVLFGCRAPTELYNFVKDYLDGDVEVLSARLDKTRYELHVS